MNSFYDKKSVTVTATYNLAAQGWGYKGGSGVTGSAAIPNMRANASLVGFIKTSDSKRSCVSSYYTAARRSKIERTT